ncbi:MAG: hypothetical protein WC679_02505 [Bacteroidales bacterium]|jgi:hypothetical protein
MVKQTAVIFSLIGDINNSFFVVDEDITKFDDVYINQWCDDYTEEQQLEHEKLQDEFNDYFYDVDGDFKIPQTNKRGLEEAIHNGATLIMCGFIL